MQPQQLEVGRGGGPLRRRDEIGRIHPELAGPIVADEPDALETGVLGDRGSEEDRLPPARLRRDGLEPAELARRLDGDGANPGRNGGTQLFVAACRARS